MLVSISVDGVRLHAQKRLLQIYRTPRPPICTDCVHHASLHPLPTHDCYPIHLRQHLRAPRTPRSLHLRPRQPLPD